VWRDAIRGAPRASLRVKLVAVLLCLLAAAAVVIVTVGASALRGQLIRQAGGQIRMYAHELTSQPFQLLGTSRAAPAAIVPFNGLGTGGEARPPGAADRVGAAGASSPPSASRAKGATAATGASSTSAATVGVFAGPRGVSIELRGPGGQLLLSTGPGTRPGLALPAAFAPVPARTGVLRTVQGVGGSYLVIAEPVHFAVQRLVFGYGADDFAVTGGARTGQKGQPGRTGTMVVGLRLASIDQPARRLTLLAVAVSAAVILIAGGLAWAAIRFFLRPVTRAARAADAAAAVLGGDGSEVAHEVAHLVPGGPAGGLAGSLHTVLSRLDGQAVASGGAAAAADAAAGQLAARLESVAGALRRPISLLHGRAEHWAHRDQGRSADPDRALGQIAAYAAEAEALLDEVDEARG
jgi:hypothetical protein